MRKLGVFSLVIAMMMLVTASVTWAANWTVCPGGVGCAFGNIQNAIDFGGTVNGDTITVAAGVYVENVTVNKSLTLKGHSALDTFVFSTAAANTAITITADNVTVSGFHVYGGNATGVRGIFVVAGSDFPTITKCTVEKSSIGIEVQPSNSPRIMNNIVRNACGYAAGTWDGIGIFFNTDTGWATPNALIQKNIVYDNDFWGIHVNGDYGGGGGANGSFANMLITTNSIYNNGAWDQNNPGDWNFQAIGIQDAAGPITLTNNKILNTWWTWLIPLISVTNSTGVAGSGNKQYNNLKPATLTGTNTAILGW